MKVWSTNRTRFFFAASSQSRRASSDDAVMGFSTHTCLPAAMACMHSSKWEATGVMIATASMLVSASTSAMLWVVRTSG